MSTVLKVILKLALIIICVFAIIIVAVYLYFNFRTVEPQASSPPEATKSEMPSPSGVSVSVEVSEADAAILIQDAVKDTLPIDDLDISFDSSGSASVSGTVKKSDIEGLSGNSSIPDAVLLAAQLLPEVVDVTLDINPTVDSAGNIDIGAESCTIGGLKIDAKYLPDGFMDNINNQISAYAEQNGISVTDITVQDGKLMLSGKVID